MAEPNLLPSASPVNTPNQFQAGFFTKVQTSLSDTAANLASANAVLIQGQVAYETDTKKFKIGDGTTTYNSLSYQASYTSGTAAALASANPVLQAGQIGYETDTISFKIGDGSTAYNSLTYAYRGLVVAGEPSMGTPHPCSDANLSTTALVDTGTNTAGTWSAAVTMTGRPTGARAGYCHVSIAKGSAAPILSVAPATGITLSDISTGNNWRKYVSIRSPSSGAGAGYGGTMVWIPIDSNGQFKWCTTDSNSTVLIGPPVQYDI
jgi:hypothetical protein